VKKIMKKMGTLSWIAFILLLVGGLNWGLVGFFKFDLVAAIFGDMTAVSRVVYALIGLAALYKLAVIVMKDEKKEE